MARKEKQAWCGRCDKLLHVTRFQAPMRIGVRQ